MGYPAYASWDKHDKSAGCAFVGNLMILQTRWHEYIQPGFWQVLMNYRSRYDSYYAVVDDFGELVPSEARITVDDPD